MGAAVRVTDEDVKDAQAELPSIYESREMLMVRCPRSAGYTDKETLADLETKALSPARLP